MSKPSELRDVGGKDISLFELNLFHLAIQTGSLRALSRGMNLQPAHVSKVLKRLERKIGMRLFQRTAQGLTVTPEGLLIHDKVKSILTLGEEICNTQGEGRTTARSRVWTFGSISFLSTYCLAHAVTEVARTRDQQRFRLVEFTHNDLVAYALRGAFELALHIGPLEWTRVWMSRPVGTLKWNLYANNDHPLGAQSTQEAVEAFPFIAPTDWSDQGYAVGEDFCPLPVQSRIRGHEAATAETALEITRSSDNLAFVPEIVAEPWVRGNLVRKIKVRDWPVVEKDIFLSFRSDLLPNPLVKDFISEIKSRLKGVGNIEKPIG